jgi:hypothetical protein
MTEYIEDDSIIDENQIMWYIYGQTLFNVDQDNVHPILTDNQITVLKLKYGSDLYVYSVINDDYNYRPLW